MTFHDELNEMRRRAGLPIKEQNIPGWDDEEEDHRFDALPDMKAIAAAKPAIIKLVQKKYSEWRQDETGHDEEVGYGGICHLFADLIAEVLNEAGIPAATVSSSHEVHVYTVAQARDGVFEVDIPYCVYETGGGYNWTKIQDVEFTLDDIIINRLSPDPADFEQFIEEY